MFKRKIYSEIEAWYESLKIKKRALIIKGLRQIGKTTIAKSFAYSNYENVVYINFMNDTEVKEYFNGNLSVPLLITYLSSYYTNQQFVPGKTVIIFDEIQECSRARSSIKAFMEDGSYDIIATGSLIGLRGYKKQNSSIPVGFEKTIEMKPMDFEEYLWAIGVNENALQMLNQSFNSLKGVPKPINDNIMRYFKEYLCVGGMPDVVSTFIETHNLQMVRDFQLGLLESFKDDFAKHLNDDDNTEIDESLLTRIIDVYNVIPAQLAKKNKKFIYSEISKNARGREYLDAIIWLEEYGLINRAYNLNVLELPLEGNKDKSAFKIYMADTGLFVAMLDETSANSILTGDLKIYKGAIYENIIADSFSKNHKKLYYYAKSSGLEIDFVTVYQNLLTAIEVKAKNNKAKSLLEVLTNKSKYDVKANYKLIDGNVGTNGIINTIPLYMASFIK